MKEKLVYPFEESKTTKKTQYTKTPPKKWTIEEENWALEQRKKGYNSREIGIALNRTETSVSLKLKRIKKRTNNNTYNEKHVYKKYNSNKIFFNEINPKSILDVYCGVNKSWEKIDNNIKIINNDLDKTIEADYNMDSLKLLCQEYLNNNKYDVVDLDPFGSAYDCFDLAIKTAKKGLVITFGEIGHKRWKRLDFIEKRYDINKVEDIEIEKMIEKVQIIGRRNKKELTPIIIDNFKNISRVYFKIDKYIETSQWDNKN